MNKNPLKLIDAHHIECSRSATFSKNPFSNIRKTPLYLYDKKKSKWSEKKYSVESMFFTKNSVIKELEDEFTKCEKWFKSLLNKINSANYPIYSIFNTDDKKNLATYVAMNLTRNPNNLDTMRHNVGIYSNNKIARSIHIDRIIPIISNAFYKQIQIVNYFVLTTDNELVCPDSIIYGAKEDINSNINYHIMPLTRNKYIIGSFSQIGDKIKNERINKVFNTSEINNLSFMSNCDLLGGDDNNIIFQSLNGWSVNSFIK